jgi:hypothetical protein
MSTKKKGAEKEKEVHLILELAGYRVARPGRVVNYIPDGKGGRRPVVSDKDLFGAFDLLAIHTERPTLFVQVCSNDARAIIDRKRKIEEVPLPRSDVAMIFAWQGGGKVLDRRYAETRYKPYQYYNLYRYWYKELDRYHVEWVWDGPVRVFKKVHLHNRCWACNRKLRHNGTCDDHPWADNGKVTL